MPKTFILLVIAGGALVFAVEEPIALPIVGGNTSPVKEFPSLVAIVRDLGSKWGIVCGGSIHNESHIVTAAHCQVDGWSSLYVVAGIYDLSQKGAGQKRSIADFIIHPDYLAEKHWLNDIAIVRLRDPLELRAGEVEKALFNRIDAPDCPETGQVCVAVGWGVTSEGGTPSDVRLKCNINIYSLDSCQKIYKTILPVPLSNSNICAGTTQGGSDACQGDSGGPLFCSCPSTATVPRVVGVVSCGKGCGRPDVPGIFTSVAHFENFVGRVTGTASVKSTAAEALSLVAIGLVIAKVV